MADNKKGFLLYADLIHTVNKMPKEMAGELFLTILRYVNDENPEPEDITVNLVFEGIKQGLKRDLKKWEKRAERSRENGALGGRPKTQKNPKKPSGLKNNPDEPRKPDSVNVNVTVNDTDINNNNTPTKVEGLDFDLLLDFINKQTGRNFRVINNAVKRKYKARLKEGYDKDSIKNAILNAVNVQSHKDNGCQYLTPEFFSRQETLDKYGTSTRETKEIKTIWG